MFKVEMIDRYQGTAFNNPQFSFLLSDISYRRGLLIGFKCISLGQTY